ncbi:MAG: hypothetical protein FJ288_13635 [Planctomycetes bacterium]|nr:hypothetical protein [Planctomycetota bacterium]
MREEAAMAGARNRGLSGPQKCLVWLLFIVPLAVVVGKWSALPTSPFLTQWCSLSAVPADLHRGARHILFVPLGAVLVVFFRLTLGIRVLGPFRSVLLAVAFQVTGVLLGLAFLAAIMAIVLAVRPLLRFVRMPYFGRVSAILSVVAAVMVLGLLASAWLGAESLHLVASLPIVVLCLMGEGLAKTLAREGWRSALWRGAMTALLAVVIALLSEVPGIRNLLLQYPELLVLQIGCIVFIAKFLNLRLLEGINPPAKRRRARARRGAHRGGKAGRTGTMAAARGGAASGSAPAAPEDPGPSA